MAWVAGTPFRIPSDALPATLRGIPYPPAGLWVLGDRSLLDGSPERFVSIVGTRSASAYGERTAVRLASAAARAGFVVVSGLARGIDACAHRAAIEAGGKTVAVLGTGVDVPYPAGHRTLHELVQQNGAVVSEMEPGRTAFPGCFPRRNRIIAALSQATIVVEAGHKSGAMNTANHVIDLGRTLASVPGPIDDPRSAGSNELLRDGAVVIGCVEDMLTALKLSTIRPDPEAGWLASGEGLDPADAVVLASLGRAPGTAETVASATGLSVGQVAGSMLRLELLGRVEGRAGSYRLQAG